MCIQVTRGDQAAHRFAIKGWTQNEGEARRCERGRFRRRLCSGGNAGMLMLAPTAAMLQHTGSTPEVETDQSEGELQQSSGSSQAVRNQLIKRPFEDGRSEGGEESGSDPDQATSISNHP